MNKIQKKMLAFTMLFSMMFEFSAYHVINAQEDSESLSETIENEKNNSESEDTEIENFSDSSSDNNENEQSDENSSEESLKIRDLLSENVKFIFDSVDKKLFTDDIYRKLKTIYNHFENFYFDTEEKTKLADLSVLNLLNENDVLTNNKNNALGIIESTFNKYSESMKNRYTTEDYQNMVEKSDLFGGHTKNTSSCAPENVIILSKYQVLSDYPIIYNDNVLISLGDVVNLLNKTINVEYMKENFNIILRLQNNDTIEISPGDNKIEINDKEKILNNPVINWQGTIFVSTDIFNFIDENANERSCKTISLQSTEDESTKVIIF